jgi:hypothetical protein
MPVIEAQCASILVPHDHSHINQIRAAVACPVTGHRTSASAGLEAPA